MQDSAHPQNLRGVANTLNPSSCETGLAAQIPFQPYFTADERNPQPWQGLWFPGNQAPNVPASYGYAGYANIPAPPAYGYPPAYEPAVVWAPLAGESNVEPPKASPAAEPPKASPAASTAPTPSKVVAKASEKAKKDLLKDLQFADETELRSLLFRMIYGIPEGIPVSVISDFEPRKKPKKVSANSMEMMSCCACLNEPEGVALLAFHGVKICQTCIDSLHAKPGITRMKLMDVFGFSKTEADKIPHSTVPGGGRFGSTSYSYKTGSIANALKKKWGSMVNWVASRM